MPDDLSSDLLADQMVAGFPYNTVPYMGKNHRPGFSASPTSHWWQDQWLRGPVAVLRLPWQHSRNAFDRAACTTAACGRGSSRRP